MIIDCRVAKQAHSAKLKLTLYWGHDQTCEKVMENMKKKMQGNPAQSVVSYRRFPSFCKEETGESA